MASVSRAILAWIGVAAATGGYLQAARLPNANRVGLPRYAIASETGASQKPSSNTVASSPLLSPRALLDTYCVTCHNERQKTAGLMLDKVDVEHVSAAADVWEKVVRKLSTGSMPPPGMRRPDPTSSSGMVSWLQTALDRAAATRPDPGRPTIHRLNRTEYANAIRDLVGIEVNGASLLPRDDSDLGFDNMAGVLSVSPALMERYMSAARKIGRLAVGDPRLVPAVETYPVRKMLFQDDRMGDDLPFGSRGGLAIRHHFPLDADYVIQIRLRRQLYDYIRGLGEPQQLEIQVDRQRVKVFTIGGERRGAPPPSSFVGDVEGDAEWEEYTQHADAQLEVRLPIRAGTRLVGVSFLRRTSELEGVLQPQLSGFSFSIDSERSSPSGKWEAAVDSVSIAGPYDAIGAGDTLSRRKVFVCRPASPGGEEPCAKKILSTLSRRAYRRPVTENDVQPLLGLYRLGRRTGGFDIGILRALEAIIVDPEFLFRVERDPANVPAGTAYRLTDLELASRLSFFLWSSIPDEELLDVAVRGKLKHPEVLDQQVRRMLADERSKALVDNFASQWLALRNLRDVGPIPELFPEFDENLRDAFQRETELFVESQLRDDRSVLDLLTANYTFVNERLARHYQIPNIYGSHFRRLTFTDDRRGGLLGHGSLLTVTAYPTRTSPVLRGHWLLENVLGTPPPPPPPDVPALRDNAENGKVQSMRERMEQHRKNPSCAACHVMMDPLGFALENFDAIGMWRATSEGGTPIDASAALPDGARFEGLPGLRTFILSRREQFVATVTEKLLTYAIGRGVEYYDMPAVRRIVREAAARDHRWSAVILGIVKSTPFQMRRTDS